MIAYTKPSLLSAAFVAALLGTAPAAFAQDKINLMMNWTADSAHLGFAVAQASGLYEAAGLEVEFTEGKGSAVAAQMVAAGQADIGLADTVAILNVASQGAPIRIISTVWKSGQFGVQYLTSSDITTPADLKGKKLAVSPGSAMQPLIPVFLRANGIADNEVEIITANSNTFLGLLTTGQVDAVSDTPEKVVIPLAAEGKEAGNLYFYTNGVPLASLSLVASEAALAEKPEAYRKFVEATAQGWQKAMEDPEAAVAALLQIFPESEHKPETLVQASAFSFNSICPGGAGDTIGVTSAETWDEMYAVLTSALNLPSDRPITDYYTLDFAPATPVLCK